MKILLVILFVCVFVGYSTANYCYWNTGCPYKYVASKTAYAAVRGDIRDTNVKLKGCEPISIWALIRHGKIYPGHETASDMKDVLVVREGVISSYLQGNSSLCAQDVENLQNWKLDNRMIGKTHQLSDEGHLESKGIASRLQQAFPKLLTKLDKENYTFRPAIGNWIEDSATAFISGIKNERLTIEKVKEEKDVMAPYIKCEKYQKEVFENPKTNTESDKYHRSSEYLAMRDRIRRRAGVDYSLTDTNITALYNWCRYTWSGIDSQTSPWCALFTTEDLKVLEYAEDLKHYYRNGYGTPMNQQLGMIPLADLLSHFQQAKEGKGKKAIAYFTHASMIEMVYTALNLFKDESPLTGARKTPDRKWRNSKFSPYSSNLLVVLNRCEKNDYNVIFYLNEEPLISFCKDGACSWQEFENKLKPFASANTDNIC